MVSHESLSQSQNTHSRYTFGGNIRKGAAPLVIFSENLTAIRFGKIVESSLVPFIRDKFPVDHKFQMDNDPKHTSHYIRDFRARNNSRTSDIFRVLLLLTCTNPSLIWQTSKPKYNATVHISINVWSFLENVRTKVILCWHVSDHFSVLISCPGFLRKQGNLLVENTCWKPRLNPIEKVWGSMKNFLLNVHFCRPENHNLAGLKKWD